MSKKLLALLVAVSTFCAFGCSDDDSDSCKTGEKRCDGNSTQTCVDGNWSTGKPCAEGCDKATGVCKPEPPKPCTTDGEKRCSGKELQECKGGNWSKVKDCKDSCDDATKACKKVDDPDNKCTATSTSKCTGACSADKKTGYFWSKDTLKTVDCPNSDCTDTNGYVQCGVIPDCTATSTERCNVACSADKSVGYYWKSKDKKVGERKCPNNDCIIKGTSVECGDGGGDKPVQCTGEKVQTGGTVGTCCDRNEYQQTCTDNGAHALVCWDGAVAQWNCADNQCSANQEKPLQVVCKKGGNTGGGSGTGDTDLENCSATSNAKCKAACAADGKGYYWDTTADTLRTKDCTTKNQTCHLEGSTVSCLDEQTDEACDKKTNPAPTCIENNTKVKYCDGTTSKYAIKACNTCVVIEGSYGCDGIESLDLCTSTSNERCRGVCTSDTEGYYWSEGLRTKKCKSGQKCVATKTGYVGCEKS